MNEAKKNKQVRLRPQDEVVYIQTGLPHFSLNK